jgi:hypothetical protein
MQINDPHAYSFRQYSLSRGSDPLQFSNRLSLPFPINAASRLGTERSKRYDDFIFALDEAEYRIREFASIMGMWSTDDDSPTAA